MNRLGYCLHIANFNFKFLLGRCLGSFIYINGADFLPLISETRCVKGPSVLAGSAGDEMKLCWLGENIHEGSVPACSKGSS